MRGIMLAVGGRPDRIVGDPREIWIDGAVRERQQRRQFSDVGAARLQVAPVAQRLGRFFPQTVDLAEVDLVVRRVSPPVAWMGAQEAVGEPLGEEAEQRAGLALLHRALALEEVHHRIRLRQSLHLEGLCRRHVAAGEAPLHHARPACGGLVGHAVAKIRRRHRDVAGTPEAERQRSGKRRSSDAVDQQSVDGAPKRTDRVDRAPKSGIALQQADTAGDDPGEKAAVQRWVAHRISRVWVGKKAEEGEVDRRISQVRPDVMMPDILQHEDEHQRDDDVSGEEQPVTAELAVIHHHVGHRPARQRDAEHKMPEAEIVKQQLRRAAVGHDDTDHDAYRIEKAALVQPG